MPTQAAVCRNNRNIWHDAKVCPHSMYDMEWASWTWNWLRENDVINKRIENGISEALLSALRIHLFVAWYFSISCTNSLFWGKITAAKILNKHDIESKYLDLINSKWIVCRITPLYHRDDPKLMHEFPHIWTSINT